MSVFGGIEAHYAPDTVQPYLPWDGPRRYPHGAPFPATEWFARLLINKRTLHHWSGSRGDAGTLTTKTYRTTTQAMAMFMKSKSVVLTPPDTIIEFSILAEKSPHRVTNPLELFHQRWLAEIDTFFTPSHTELHWVAVNGLLAEQDLAYGAAPALDRMRHHPHAIDHHHDRVIAQMTLPGGPFVNNLRPVPLFGHGVYLLPLGPVLPQHQAPSPASTHIAELLTAMCGPRVPAHKDDRKRIYDAALRLARAGHRATPLTVVGSS